MNIEPSSRRSFLVMSGVAASTGAALVAGCSNGYGNARADPDAEYRTVAEAGPQGTAPNLRTHPLTDGAYMLVLQEGDELFSALNDFAVANKVGAASFTAIGALRDVQVAWYDIEKKKFKVIPVDEQVEAASITGDIGVFDGKPAVHTHLVVAKQDGTAVAGHLLHAVTSPTIEVFVRTFPEQLAKHTDGATGLVLFD